MLDIDPLYGQGIYDAELQEPEHSNASSTALWELPALQVSKCFQFMMFHNYFINIFLFLLFIRDIIILKCVNCQKL